MNCGIDGCKKGWFAVWGDLRNHLHGVFQTIGELWAARAKARLILVDVPIGLADGEPRACDLAAREHLGQPRGSSVFPPPCRPTIAAATYEEACRINETACGRKISRQCWGIVPKIREVDAFMRGTSGARGRVRESHPEVCFWAMNGGKAMVEGKKTADGIDERLDVLVRHWPSARQTYDAILLKYLRKYVARDDIVDAMALFVAACQPKSRLRVLGGASAKDSAGLPMEMVYAEFRGKGTMIA